MNAIDLSHALVAVARWTFSTSLHASVLILLIIAVQWLFKHRLPISWSYAFGLLILIRLMLPFSPASTLSIFNLRQTFEPVHTTEPLVARESIPRLPASAGINSLTAPSAHRNIAAPANALNWQLIAASLWSVGTVLIFGNVLRQHWKLSRWCGRQLRLFDPRLVEALQDCQLLVNNCPTPKIVCSPDLKTPALFGFRRPALLLPDGILDTLNDQELRLVLLHELVHHQRRDVLLNWLFILVRSVHWFNPLVWLAVRRLRLDQEMMCDAQVLQLLSSDDRRLYGHTLLKFITRFVPASLSPSLVPLFKNSKSAQRRITMIAKFKPTNRFSPAFLSLPLLALGLLTFTRAVDNPEFDQQASNLTHPSSSPEDRNQPSPARGHQTPEKSDGLKIFKQQLMECDESISRQEANLESLRRSLQIPAHIAAAGSFPTEAPKSLQMYGQVEVDAEAQYMRENVMLTKLQNMDREQQLQVMTTISPDEILVTLVQDLNKVETKLSGLKLTFGDTHPQVQEAQAQVTNLNHKIDARIKGIMVGMQARVSSLKAVMQNSKEKMDELQAQQSKALSSYQPYFDAKQKLESSKKFREVLALRVAEGAANESLPKSKQSSPNPISR